ncbi:rRNA maturation RNase YbeY [Lutimaribacter sp. EGI FJ00015]|uniref:rRNA maturation RNase YbeY n=1 Tax=Lutimaribacter degradans TaxID=2945989 RepID=A0ACC5ZXW0_9RHOB|nr:rRNA maturation RNase YbeY [Lutimaribacter sp. EGI FJ00013]MCM2563020.1 rRNA maturation RNase YbeY [Lutimaribacter sp. EGI FJ00013]MCO0614188.1 rRNA maturation RNase YbeY [Lutimaribacter sp. EGI FJ00015]MCO0636165.1 rRNA maturation RNase YbeY [Lutimaribacter sp. EGI FJ00014]
MLVDTIIEDERWTSAGIEPLAEGAAAATLTHLGLDPSRFEIALLACDDARIAVLNADFRGKPQPTNVLSWPAEDLAATNDGNMPGLPETGPQGADAGPLQELGDIAIAYDTCAREAAEQGKQLADHATHLVVHAVLHLLGYDHIRDRDATLMEQTEVKILGKLGLPDPY